MFWNSIQDSFPEEGLECLLSCMQADGSFVELIGYRRDGEWVIETNYPEQGMFKFDTGCQWCLPER